MFSTRTAAALALASLISLPAMAQELRGSGGEVTFVKKGSQPLSGSLGVSLLDGRGGYEATLGGTLIQDRLWFFAAGSQQPTASASRFAGLALPEQAVSSAIGGKVSGRIGDAHDFSAFAQSMRMPSGAAALDVTTPGLVPSSFLSLRYTALMSSNSVFNISVSRTKTRQPLIDFEPVE